MALADPLDLPYLTADLGGVGGVIRAHHSDFVVEEIPSQAPTGEGDFFWLWIEKEGLATLRAISMLARRWRLRDRDIGYAGLKDAQAVTRQYMSVPCSVWRGAPAQVGEVARGLRVLRVERHHEHLRLGRHAGNRFELRLREVGAEADPRVRTILDVLQTRGMPNAFGEQRFGTRGNSHELGRVLLHDDARAFCDLAIGADDPREHSARAKEARRLFRLGDLNGARDAFPRSATLETRLLAVLSDTGSPAEAARRLPRGIRNTLLSAYQSWFFNRVLAKRCAALEMLLPGDHVVDLRDDQTVATATIADGDRRWLSATAPLPGARASFSAGEAGAIEREVFDQAEPDEAAFRARCKRFRFFGDRRPLRVIPVIERVEREADALLLGFTLPSGSFATSLLREVMKGAP